MIIPTLSRYLPTLIMHGGLQWVGALRFQLLHVCSASSLCWPSLVSQTGNPTKLKKLPHIHILPSSLITQAQRPQQVVSGGNAHDVPRMTRRNQRLDDTHLLVPELTYSIRPLEVWQQGCWVCVPSGWSCGGALGSIYTPITLPRRSAIVQLYNCTNT